MVLHESALLLYGLTDLFPAEIHLTMLCTASRSLAGIRFHTAHLSLEEVTRREACQSSPCRAPSRI